MSVVLPCLLYTSPSRKKILDSITLEEMPASSRKYPYVGLEPEREAGKDTLFVEGITKTVDGVKVLDNVSFIANKGDKIALVGENEAGQTALFKILTCLLYTSRCV